MRILIDRAGIQSEHHLRDNVRLSALITHLISAQHPVLFSRGPALTADELDRSHVLLMTTRRPKPDCASDNGLIRDFVWRGGGLVLLANHGNSDDTKNMTLHAARLARDCQFDVTIQRTWFSAKSDGELITMSGQDLNAAHPIIAGTGASGATRSLVTSTCCSLSTGTADSLVKLSEQMRERLDRRDPQGLHFAVALQAGTGLPANCKGRVVVVADSGFVGNDGTAYPGVGLAGHGDNLRFVLNALAWLAGELDARPEPE